MAPPAGRARFVDHKGKRIYLIDASGLSPDDVALLADQVARDVRAQPPKSVMTITHVEGVPLERKMIEKLRWLAEGNKPHVKAACITGLSAVQRMIFNTVKILTGRDFVVLATVDQAKDHLAGLK